jgi:three-Cys-motif partner protein
MKKKRFNPIIYAKDDDLIIPEVGSWAINKYQYFGGYCEIFTKTMTPPRWKNLIYIDLFSGSGFSRIRDTGRIIFGSPLIALSTPIPFTKYYFCEENREYYDALKIRVGKLFDDSDVKYFHGDANEIFDELIDSLPKFGKKNTGLSFIFIDPYKLNLHFSTIKKLSKLIADFLILLPLYMDLNRNFSLYYKEGNKTMEYFLDDPKWRDKLKTTFKDDPTSVVYYMGNAYRTNMADLGFNFAGDFIQVRSDKKNLPLYYLAFFSRHELGEKFWNIAQKYADDQQRLF